MANNNVNNSVAIRTAMIPTTQYSFLDTDRSFQLIKAALLHKGLFYSQIQFKIMLFKACLGVSTPLFL